MSTPVSSSRASSPESGPIPVPQSGPLPEPPSSLPPNGLPAPDAAQTSVAENLLTPTEWAHLSKRDQRILRGILGRIVQRSSLGQTSAEELMAARTLGERIADRVAAFGGSWTFIISFLLFLLVWTTINALVLRTRAFDPYPFIFLNLLLSMIAALQAPIIMMSQNRQAHRDRLAAQNDYEVNMKAEVEIRELHAKLDELREGQWMQLVAQQEEQIKLLSALCGDGAVASMRKGADRARTDSDVSAQPTTPSRTR